MPNIRAQLHLAKVYPATPQAPQPNLNPLNTAKLRAKGPMLQFPRAHLGDPASSDADFVPTAQNHPKALCSYACMSYGLRI